MLRTLTHACSASSSWVRPAAMRCCLSKWPNVGAMATSLQAQPGWGGPARTRDVLGKRLAGDQHAVDYHALLQTVQSIPRPIAGETAGGTAGFTWSCPPTRRRIKVQGVIAPSAA